MKTNLKPKQTARQRRINYFATFKNYAKEQYKDMLILTFDNASGQPAAAIYESTRGEKPAYLYRFNSTFERLEFIQQRKVKADQREKEREEREQRYNEEKKQFKEGVILYSSWGYEQTNIDFYIILSRKNDFVVIQQIGQKRTYDNNFNDRGSTTPDPSIKIGEPIRKKISKYATINLNSYTYCGLYDGRPKSWSSYA